MKRALRSQISFQWLHEDVLAENLTLDKKYERVNVIKDLQEVMKEVRKFEKIMNELIVKIDQAEVSSLKRLQWSVGTNPRLKSVHQSVVQGREERKIFLAENIETAKRVEKLIEGVIMFESLRLPGFESNKFDSEMINILEMGSKIIQECEISASTFGADEIALTEFVPPVNVDDQEKLEQFVILSLLINPHAPVAQKSADQR